MLVSIWGFMGSGKSTLGKHMADQYHWQHIDSDEEIERQENKAITAIFESEGEVYFRELETTFLKQMLNKLQADKGTSKVIFTTGGGMPLKEENRNFLKKLGPSVYLHVPFEEIVNRLQGDQTRPLWNKHQLTAMQKKWEERLPLYQQADFCLDAGQKDLAQIAQEIMSFLHLDTER